MIAARFFVELPFSHGAPAELKCELAARLRDEVAELKPDLWQMSNVGHLSESVLTTQRTTAPRKNSNVPAADIRIIATAATASHQSSKAAANCVE